MIVHKIWEQPWVNEWVEDAPNTGPAYMRATVYHEDMGFLDTNFELEFDTYKEAYKFWREFNSVDGGVRWGD